MTNVTKIATPAAKLEAKAAPANPVGKTSRGASLTDREPSKAAQDYISQLHGDIKQQQLIAAEQEVAIRSELTELKALETEGQEASATFKSKAAHSALALYQSRKAGLLDAGRVTAILGDVFGFKVSEISGKESKTPKGEGETIRKRVVRAVMVDDFVNGRDSDFANNIHPDRVEEVKAAAAQALTDMEKGETSIYTLYETTAKIKREARSETQTGLAFDAKKLAALRDSMLSETTIAALAVNIPLAIAYVELGEAIAFATAQALEIAKAA